jgi:hypothetical protein
MFLPTQHRQAHKYDITIPSVAKYQAWIQFFPHGFPIKFWHKAITNVKLRAHLGRRGGGTGDGDGDDTHAFNPSTQGSRGRLISEFEANLVYKVSPGLPGLHRGTLSQARKQTKTKTTTTTPKTMRKEKEKVRTS